MLVGRLSRPLMAMLALGLACCSPGKGAPEAAGAPAPAAASNPAAAPVRSPEPLTVRVVSVRPHDTGAYTQGLVWDRGTLYESDGLYGASNLRVVDPVTGEVKKKVPLAQRYFAEGLALVGDRLIQLTWQEGTAFVYKASTLEPVEELPYQGEGWGLCYDGRRLVMSDGSSRLTFRDPKTLAVLGSVEVRKAGLPVDRINELECVDGAVWANVWMTEEILRIDPATGEVTGVVDASGLLDASAYAAGAEVLNGIAWMPETKTFLITGKRWPSMFEVEIVP